MHFLWKLHFSMAIYIFWDEILSKILYKIEARGKKFISLTSTFMRIPRSGPTPRSIQVEWLATFTVTTSCVMSAIANQFPFPVSKNIIKPIHHSHVKHGNNRPSLHFVPTNYNNFFLPMTQQSLVILLVMNAARSVTITFTPSPNSKVSDTVESLKTSISVHARSRGSSTTAHYLSA